MKKITMAIIAGLVVTTSHAALAGGEHMDRNKTAYSGQAAMKSSGQAVAANPDYQFDSQPHLRTAKRNQEHFKNQPSSGSTAAGANKADYEFNSQPEKRLAARNAAYFNQK